MCISVPARIVRISGEVLAMAEVDVAGRTRQVCLAYFPDARVGDYVLTQNGFAVSLLDPQEAAESLAAFDELGAGFEDD